MLRLKDIPPEEMPEVVRVANELYEKDRRRAEQDQERRNYVDAAEELGVPPEYMEQAAQELHRRRVAEAEVKNRSKVWKSVAIGGGVGVLTVFLMMGMFTVRSVETVPATPVQQVAQAQPEFLTQVAPETFDAGAANRWTFTMNPSTRATTTFEEEEGLRRGVAVIRVEQFGTTGGPHRANFESIQTPPSLAGKKEIQFDLRGQGLKNIRVYLERGQNERWRSPELKIPSGWQSVRVPLGNFQHQVHSGGRWRTRGRVRPDQIDRVSFKLGDFMNEPSAKGEVRLDNVRFE